MPMSDEHAATSAHCGELSGSRIMIPFDPKHGGADPRETFAKFRQKFFAAHAEGAGCRLCGIAVQDHLVCARKRCY